MKHYDFEISLLVENELPENKKEELFLHLAKCRKCSKTLSDFRQLKSSVTSFYSDLPGSKNELEYGGTNNLILKRKSSFSKYIIPLSFAAFIILMFFLLSTLEFNRQKLNSANQGSKLESISVQIEETGLNDPKDVIYFNSVRDEILASREADDISKELLKLHPENKTDEFNSVINKFLYNNYHN
jgi:hypothetical protein